MLVTLLPTVTLLRPKHASNAPLPMVMTLLGILTLLNAVLKNTPSGSEAVPMLVTLLPIIMLVKKLQFQKAPFPMLVTLLGMVTLFSKESENALVPMLVTGNPLVALGMTTVLSVPV